MACLGVVAPVDAEAVALAGPDAGQVGVPGVGGALGQLEALLRAVDCAVEQAQLHTVGGLREDREVRAAAVPGRPEWEGVSGPDRLAHRTSAPASGGRTTWPGSTVAWWVASSSSTGRSTGTWTWFCEKLASTRCSPRRTRSQPWCSSKSACASPGPIARRASSRRA